MNLPQVVSRDDWLVARQALLVKEKAMTRARDELNSERRRLPMVKIDELYSLKGSAGTVSLLDMFEGRDQLVIYHFMFHPDWDQGCPSCSWFVDNIGHLAHLNASGITFAAVSRAPFAKIEKFKERMGWTFPWYSSYGSSFNYDFHVTLDESVTPIVWNYRTKADDERIGPGYLQGEQPFEMPGLSCFLRDGEVIFHTFSTFARGLDMIGFTVNVMDQTALGRQEEWEEPKGRRTEPDTELHYHDEYDL